DRDSIYSRFGGRDAGGWAGGLAVSPHRIVGGCWIPGGWHGDRAAHRVDSVDRRNGEYPEPVAGGPGIPDVRDRDGAELAPFAAIASFGRYCHGRGGASRFQWDPADRPRVWLVGGGEPFSGGDAGGVEFGGYRKVLERSWRDPPKKRAAGAWDHRAGRYRGDPRADIFDFLRGGRGSG